MATNVFELYAKIGADTKDFDKGLSTAKDKFSGFADGLKSAAGKVGDILAGIGKAAAVGIGAASTALVGLTKQTLDAVGSFEQLEGGAQKIFDEMDFDKISTDAKNAYKELNMSASEYLEAINLAGATFAQTMGDEKGYDTARKGMLAIADYASGTGRNLEELNQKYQMITRATSSYQSIADQFAGILPATSADFLEQAKAAGFLKDTYEKLTDVPVAEYQQALTDMLDRGVNKLGLSNNTLRESTETLTGSFAMARAAWQNFLTGQGSTQDFVKAFSSAIEQTRSKLKEIIPRLTDGLTELVDLLAPEIPPIIEDTLPTIIDGASKLLTGLASRLPELLTAILPSLATGVVNITVELVKVMPQIIASLKESIPIIVKTIMSKKDELLKAGKDIIKALFPKGLSGVTEIASKATEVIGDLAVKLTNPDNLSKIFNTGLDIITSIADGLLSQESIDKFIETVPTVIKNLATALTDFVTGGDDGEGGLLDAVYNIVDKICTYFDDPQNRTNFFMAAEDIILTLGDFLVENAGKIVPFIIKLAQRIAETLVSSLFDSIRELFDDEAGWMDEYLNTDTNLSYTEWAKQRHEKERTAESESHRYVGQAGSYDYSEGMLVANRAGQFQNAAAVEAYNKYKASQNAHAAGFVADRPTWLGGHLIGEAGTEALIPLESNTQWMDTFADKLGARMGGGVVIEQMIINAPSGNAEDIQAAFLDNLDEALRNRQITQNRGVGAVAWK